MSRKARMIEDILICSCGTRNYQNGWVSGLVDDIIDYSGSVEDKETITCSSCDRKYEVTIDVSVSVDVSTVSLEEIVINKYTDKNGDEISQDFFDKVANLVAFFYTTYLF